MGIKNEKKQRGWTSGPPVVENEHSHSSKNTQQKTCLASLFRSVYSIAFTVQCQQSFFGCFVTK